VPDAGESCERAQDVAQRMRGADAIPPPAARKGRKRRGVQYGPPYGPRGRGNHEAYCETLLDVKAACDRQGLDFRTEIIAMMERWLSERRAAA
jgi:hypothetical protein